MDTGIKISPALIGAGVLVLILIVIGFWFLPQKQEGALQSAEEASGAVPEISTNPAESVPEVNPVDRANPFKYDNPLR
ncbi:MAG: hypothetical protein HY457_02795 [Parcubacteria group bacterium]|nr:hypothetical protein [Parcubacteria group bacterium]